VDLRFHCTTRLARAIRRSKHFVGRECERVKTVLRAHHEYGVVIPRHAPLRKMRVHVHALNCGKSGGYRMVYRTAHVDEVRYVVLLDLWFKVDREDLGADEYSTLLAEADAILRDPLAHLWE
jgi:hypothetical protein